MAYLVSRFVADHGGLWPMRSQLSEVLHMRAATVERDLEDTGISLEGKELEEWFHSGAVTGRQVAFEVKGVPWFVEVRRVEVID